MSHSDSEQAAHGHGGHDSAGHDGGHGHDGENVYPYTPHHFSASKQHFDSGKLGVWLFLVTEILFFAGLFCAYTIYRAQNPEVFYWAHFFLDTKLGAANTVVLILSSFTAAWAVRNAQIGQVGLLKMNIVLTICGAFFFMGVKTVEYTHKFHDGLLPAGKFAPTHNVWETETFQHKHPEAAKAAERISAGLQARKNKKTALNDTVVGGSQKLGLVPVSHEEHGKVAVVLPPEDPKTAALADDVWLAEKIRLLTPKQRHPLEMSGIIRKASAGPPKFDRPEKAGIFFSIYFFMTGLHGFHVVVGIGIWIWMLTIAARRRFGPEYYGPIEFSALYWHLVDLIWIYLFPMLYLIH